ncbi:MAG TPA: metallophosphoesterase family protein [Candidatus Saccharimonadia bacterium]|nr:metallophosphoesterase family protein [Candidatus Saccharimonadia bacterium]
MKHALFSDLHASEVGLTKLLAHPAFKGAHKRICLGDVINAHDITTAAEYFVRVKDASDLILRGNHEAVLTGQCDIAVFNPRVREAISNAKKQLETENGSLLQELSALVSTYALGDMQLTHGSFNTANPWKHVRYTEDVQAEEGYMPSNVCVTAHGHIPFIAWQEEGLWYYQRQLYDSPFLLKRDTKWYVNTGSILGSREMRAYERTFLVYDDEARTVTFHNLEDT